VQTYRPHPFQLSMSFFYFESYSPHQFRES
jgi:hypothetical protein